MTEAVELASGVYRIPTMGDYINTFVFVDDDESVTLVDVGLKRAPARIVQGLESIGKSVADVQRIVLTHAHLDHAGGAQQMVRDADLDGVDIHEADAPFAEAGENPLPDRSILAGRLFGRLPGGKFDPVPVASMFQGGDVLPIAGGLQVHHTPGHTPGHVGLLHQGAGLLITGDSIMNMASRMFLSPAPLCSSAKLNKETAHVLGELEYDVVGFTHGPHISENAREAVRGFLKKKGAL